MKKQLLLALSFAHILNICAETNWYHETLHTHWQQAFSIDELLFQEKTEHQDLIIFKNNTYGTVLALDGIIQSTQKDESAYHEMIVHVPLLAHANPKKVLIIGGGDGGSLREVLRHKTVEKATLVEIDASVIALSKQYLPDHSHGAFENPRAEIIIHDGCKFAKESQEKYDVIIIDSSDPVGPGEVLFTKEFYGDCKNLLTQNGILVVQGGAPFMQHDELVMIHNNLTPHFNTVSFYGTVVPTYVGGFMVLGFATNDKTNLTVSPQEIESRFSKIDGTFKYYTPALHQGSFALPQFIKNIVTQ